MKTAPELLADVEAKQKALRSVVESVLINRFHHTSILAAAFAFAEASAAYAAQATGEEIARLQRASAPVTTVGLN